MITTLLIGQLLNSEAVCEDERVHALYHKLVDDGAGCPDPDPRREFVKLLGYYVEELLGGTEPPSATGASLEIADVNNDGHLDVVVARGAPHSIGDIRVYYGGASVDGYALDTTSVVLPGKAAFSQAALGDLDGDGCLDLVAGFGFVRLAGEVRGGVYVYMAEGEGEGEARRCSFPAHRPPRELMRSPEAENGIFYGVTDVALGDYDANGKLDLAVAQVHNLDYSTPRAQAIYLDVGEWARGEPGEFPDDEIVWTEGEIGGNSSVEFLDVDRNRALDVLFVGASVNGHDSSWGLLRLDDGREIELLGADPKATFSKVPHAMDLEVLPPVGDRARIAVTFNHHLCSSGCKRDATARVFELGKPSQASAELSVTEIWSSASGCRGYLTRIAAGWLAGADDQALVFNWNGPGRDPGPGKLVIVEGKDGGFESIAEAEHAYASGKDRGIGSWALEISDLDGRDLDGRVTEPETWSDLSARGRKLIEVPGSLHHAPVVTCDKTPAKILFTPGSRFVTLAQPCGSAEQAAALEVRWRAERAGDIIYVANICDPEHHYQCDSSRPRTLRRLRARNTE